MSPLTLRRGLRRVRRHTSTVMAVTALATAVAAHHSSIVTGDAHHGEGLPASVELCLAVFMAVGTATLALALGGLLLRRLRPFLRSVPASTALSRLPPDPRARAGPALVSVLCVSRQ